MTTARITISFAVPVGYTSGDYTYLHGNDGSGSIDYDTALNNAKFQLFPRGGGIYGWGHAPWGKSPWGKAYSVRVNGWGHLPWGKTPWGRGTALIAAAYRVTECGEYKFAFNCYDSLGNLHAGTPEEITAYVHIAPPAPTGLTKNSYDKATDVLILDAA